MHSLYPNGLIPLGDRVDEAEQPDIAMQCPYMNHPQQNDAEDG